MTREGLIEALRRREAEDAQALWREVHARADGLRSAAETVVANERAALAAQTATLARRAALAIAAEADRTARDAQLEAENALDGRLHALAPRELAWLRSEGGDALFAALAAELPARAWERIRVHPDDEAIARRLFPAAAVTGDPAVAGGLSAEADGGRVAVDNTLGARLDSAWADLLPSLIHSIRSEAGDHRTPA